MRSSNRWNTATLCGLFLACLSASGQEAYHFERLQEAYQPLSSPVVLNPGISYVGHDNYTVPLGFEFEFFGWPLHSIKVQRNGIVLLGTQDEFIAALRPQLAVTPESRVGYQIFTQGPCRQQVFCVEWQRMGLLCEGDSIAGEVSLQMWLYEDSHRIELRYGPSEQAELASSCPPSWHSTYGPRLRFSDATMAAVTGSYEQPSLAYGRSAVQNAQDLQLGIPPEGTVYRFTPASTAQEPVFRAGPNPARSVVYVQPRSLGCQPYRLVLADLTGRVHVRAESSAQQIPVDLSGFRAGWYVLQLQYLDGSGTHTVKLLITE